MTAPVSLLGALSAAVRFLPRGWRATWPGVLVAVVLLAAAFDGRLMGWTGTAIGAAAAIALIDLQGALYVAALARAPEGVRARLLADVRLLAVAILKFVLLTILGLILFVLILAAAYGVASAGTGFKAADVATWAPAVDARGRVLVEVLGSVGALALAWVVLRLALAEAATVALGRVQVLSTWPATGPLLAPLAAAAVTVGAPLVAALWLVRFLCAASPGGLVHASCDVAQGVLVAAFILPLNAGLMTYLYLQITRPDPVPPA